VFHSKECRRKAEEADELAQKTTDAAVRTAYEEIARRWREMAERAERNVVGRLLGGRSDLFLGACPFRPPCAPVVP
jgi:hypothetical protein